MKTFKNLEELGAKIKSSDVDSPKKVQILADIKAKQAKSVKK